MKKRFIFCCAVFILFCPVVGVSAISGVQKSSIVDNCSEIREILKNIQKSDSRARVFFGRNYELILTKYIMPLNVRLLESNLSSVGLVENQNEFAKQKNIFSQDFINYQQILEELVAMDCKKEPEAFYEKLTTVRKKRQTVEQDVLKMRNLFSEHLKLVRDLEGKI